MTQPPRKLSTDRRSPNYDPCYTHVGVYFNGVKRPNDVHEYDADAGWVDIRNRNSRGQFIITQDGTYITERLTGKVEPYWSKSVMVYEKADLGPVDHNAHLAAAEAKRARKAARLAKLAGNG